MVGTSQDIVEIEMDFTEKGGFGEGWRLMLYHWNTTKQGGYTTLGCIWPRLC